MRKQIILILGVMIFAISGCSNNTNNVQEEEKIVYENDDSEESQQDSLDEYEYTEDVETDVIPQHITELFEQYDYVISQGAYDISLGEKVGVDDREEDCTFYIISLCPSDPDIISYPYVQFYSDNESTDKSFSVYGLDNCENESVKEIIYCTLVATNPDMDEKDIKNLQKDLINSFDGYSQSNIIETERYKYFLTSDMILEVVDKEEINAPVDKSLYSEFTQKEMLAELNKGELAVVRGTVAYDTEEDYHNTLCVVNGNDKYYIYYSPTSFPGIFKEDKEYIFYGAIASSADLESGCLGLDYYEAIEK